MNDGTLAAQGSNRLLMSNSVQPTISRGKLRTDCRFTL